jgi:hypothetical protein
VGTIEAGKFLFSPITRIMAVMLRAGVTSTKEQIW